MQAILLRFFFLSRRATGPFSLPLLIGVRLRALLDFLAVHLLLLDAQPFFSSIDFLPVLLCTARSVLSALAKYLQVLKVMPAQLPKVKAKPLNALAMSLAMSNVMADGRKRPLLMPVTMSRPCGRTRHTNP